MAFPGFGNARFCIGTIMSGMDVVLWSNVAVLCSIVGVMCGEVLLSMGIVQCCMVSCL